MTERPPVTDGIAEMCEKCNAETEHRVTIEIVTESQKEEGAEFSREPYRVSQCCSCGVETFQRMNNM